MKKTTLTGVLAMAGFSALLLAPSLANASGIGYETCKDYNCVSVVRQKANTFHLTKGVLKLTNQFISKVETKADSKFNGRDTADGKQYQYRIYGVTSKKFLEVSLLLRTAQFSKTVKNSEKLAKVCYDLAEIFKIKSQIANGEYKGGHYHFDKYFGNLNGWQTLANAAKALKEKLDNPNVVKDAAYDAAKKFYDENLAKVGDGTAAGSKLTEAQAKALADDFNKHKDALTIDNDTLEGAAKALKEKLDNPNVVKNSAYDAAKKFYDDNIAKVGDKNLSPEDAKKLKDEFKKHKDALSIDNDTLEAVAKALKDKLDNPNVVKNGAYDAAKKFYDDNIAKVGDKNLSPEDAKKLKDEFKKHKDALTLNGNLDALKNAADKLKDKLNDKNVIKDKAYDDAKKFYDDNADKAKNGNLGEDEAKRLADDFKKYMDALNFADWLDDLRAAARELKSGLDNPNVKQDAAYDAGKRFYDDNIRKTDDTSLPKAVAQELAREFRALKDRLSRNDGNAGNLSTNGDTVVAGDAIKEMFKWMKSADKNKSTVNVAYQKYFENQKASGLYFDTEYTLGIGEGSDTVIPNGTTKYDLSKFVSEGRLTLVTIGYRVENFEVVNSKYVKLFNNKIVGFREGGSERDTGAMDLINEYNKGWLNSGQGYYGFAPFANKTQAQDFINQQKMSGAKAIKLGTSGKYMVAFPSGM